MKSVSEEHERSSLKSVRVEGRWSGITVDSKAVLEAVESWTSDRHQEKYKHCQEMSQRSELQGSDDGQGANSQAGTRRV